MRRLFKTNKNSLRKVRHTRVRAKVSGTKECPRLSVFRSASSMIAQLVDDEAGKTLCYAWGKEIKTVKAEGKKGKEAISYLVGKLLAEKALAKGIKKAVFDRGGYKYHGRVKSLADGAREGGLQF